MRTILLATTNRGKVSEMAALLEGTDCRVMGLADLSDRPPAVEETGTTFRENALLKAGYYFARTGCLTLADDSGLVVDALGGRPGVFSARYGGEGLTDEERNLRLLEEMKEIPADRRSARFVCSLALIGPEIRRIFEETCEGAIAFGPRGVRGFGYDPIFIDPSSGRTFAELTPEEKSLRSHRGKAMRVLRKFLEGEVV